MNIKIVGLRFNNLLLILSAIFASFLFMLPTSACGCGIMITLSDAGRWAYGNDSSEQSYINLDKGVEKLIISLDIKNTSKDSVLVIPIPSQPQSIKADILSEVPVFTGYDVKDRAKENLTTIRDSILATQIYPIVPIILTKSLGTGANFLGDSKFLTNATDGTIGGGIVVYQHLEKNGMIAEVLSAATSDDLYRYLTEKGLKVEKDSIPIFRDYIRSDFAFVVSWINLSTDEKTAKGVYMTFPASKIFYPLKPGSAYSGDGMDKMITIMGHVTPEIYSGIKDSTSVRYFYSDLGISSSDDALNDFFVSEKGFKFTKVVTTAAPRNLTEDLFISSRSPLSIVNAQIINRYTFIYGLILMILISFMSTYVIIRLVLPSLNLKSKLVQLSLMNSMTIIGTIVASKVIVKQKRFKYTALFSITFVIVTLLVWYLLKLLYQ